MADLAKVSLFLRRLEVTFLLAFLLFSVIALVYPEADCNLFLPCWIALFIASPYLDRKSARKPKLNILNALSPRRPKRSTGLGAGHRHRRRRIWSLVRACAIALFPIPFSDGIDLVGSHLGL